MVMKKKRILGRSLKGRERIGMQGTLCVLWNIWRTGITVLIIEWDFCGLVSLFEFSILLDWGGEVGAFFFEAFFFFVDTLNIFVTSI